MIVMAAVGALAIVAILAAGLYYIYNRFVKREK